VYLKNKLSCEIHHPADTGRNLAILRHCMNYWPLPVDSPSSDNGQNIAGWQHAVGTGPRTALMNSELPNLNIIMRNVFQLSLSDNV
jgi:hypothetical protein